MVKGDRICEIIGKDHEEKGEKKRQDDHAMNGGKSCYHRNGGSNKVNSWIDVIRKIPGCQDLTRSSDMGKGIRDRIEVISPYELKGQNDGIEEQQEDCAKKPAPEGIG